MALRRRQQPQVPVAIDLSNPLCRGIRVVWNGATPDSIWYQGAWVRTASKTAGVTAGINGSGRAAQTGWTTDQIVTGLTANQVLPNNNVTLGFVRRNADTTARVASLAGYADSATDRSIIHAPFSDGNAYWDFGNQTAGSGRLSVAFSKSTAVESLAFVAGAIKGREIWRNGKRIANNAAATAARGSSSTPYWLMRYGGVGEVPADIQTQNLFVSWWRELSDAELAAWSENPWQIFAPVKRRILVAFDSAGGSIGSSSVTLGDVTQTATGTVGPSPIVGASSVTVGQITGATAGNVVIGGASSLAIAAVTQAASGAVTVSGAGAPPVGAITGSATGTVVSGITGSSSVTLGAVTQTATGVVGSVPITGTSSVTVGQVASASVGTVRVAGASSVAIAAVTPTASGTVAVSGASAPAVGSVTGSAAGTVVSGMTGASAITLGAVTQTAAGAVLVSGAASQAVGQVTQAMAGSAQASGSSSVTLGSVVSAAVGSVAVSGSSSQTLQAVVSAASGQILVTGIAAASLGSVTQTFTGQVPRDSGVAPLRRLMKINPRGRTFTA